MKWTLEAVRIAVSIILILSILSFFNYVTIGVIISQLTVGIILTLITFFVESLVNFYKLFRCIS